MIQHYDLVRRSVYEAVAASMDELPYYTTNKALEILRRVEDRMPKLFSFVSADEEKHLKPFKDLVASLPRLPPPNGAVASVKEIDHWLLEVTLEAHVTFPYEEHRTCVYTLMRRVLCFTREDIIDLDVGFYRAMMAFVRPLRDSITEHNNTV